MKLKFTKIIILLFTAFDKIWMKSVIGISDGFFCRKAKRRMKKGNCFVFVLALLFGAVPLEGVIWMVPLGGSAGFENGSVGDICYFLFTYPHNLFRIPYRTTRASTRPLTGRTPIASQRSTATWKHNHITIHLISPLLLRFLIFSSFHINCLTYSTASGNQVVSLPSIYREDLFPRHGHHGSFQPQPRCTVRRWHRERYWGWTILEIWSLPITSPLIITFFLSSVTINISYLLNALLITTVPHSDPSWLRHAYSCQPTDAWDRHFGFASTLRVLWNGHGHLGERIGKGSRCPQ